MSLITAGTMNIPNLHYRNPSSICILHTSGILIKAFAKLGIKRIGSVIHKVSKMEGKNLGFMTDLILYCGDEIHIKGNEMSG